MLLFTLAFQAKKSTWGGELEQILGLPLEQHRHRCLVSEETAEPWLQLPKAAHQTFSIRVYGKAVVQKREVERGVFGVTHLGCWQPQTAHCCKLWGFPRVMFQCMALQGLLTFIRRSKNSYYIHEGRELIWKIFVVPLVHNWVNKATPWLKKDCGFWGQFPQHLGSGVLAHDITGCCWGYCSLFIMSMLKSKLMLQLHWVKIGQHALLLFVLSTRACRWFHKDELAVSTFLDITSIIFHKGRGEMLTAWAKAAFGIVQCLNQRSRQPRWRNKERGTWIGEDTDF